MDVNLNVKLASLQCARQPPSTHTFISIALLYLCTSNLKQKRTVTYMFIVTFKFDLNLNLVNDQLVAGIRPYFKIMLIQITLRCHLFAAPLHRVMLSNEISLLLPLSAHLNSPLIFFNGSEPASHLAVLFLSHSIKISPMGQGYTVVLHLSLYHVRLL